MDNFEQNNLDKDRLVEIIRTQTNSELNDLLLDIIKDYVYKKKDLRGLYELFSPAYDEVYHDLIFNKIKMTKDSRKLFEMFSIPLYKKTPEEQQKIIEEFLST